MQHIIILKDVEIPNTPSFHKGQKVRVADHIADLLVERDFAQYDGGEKPTTNKAKIAKETKASESKQAFDGAESHKKEETKAK